MTEAATQPKGNAAPTANANGPKKDARSFRLRRGPNDRRGGGRFGKRRDPRADIPEQSDYEEKTLEISRVTRVTAGGKRMRFRALGIVGNRKGRVGFGLGKGLDVAGATSKAFAQARKSLITIPMKNETIPHEIVMKFGSAKVLLKPAPKGTGVKAGGAVRQVLEIAGIPNIVAKIMGSPNKVNNVKATIKALSELRQPLKAATDGKDEGKEKKTKESKSKNA
ncbi:30S ribosomal protein S5 [Candidatus Uhrbacteria bacterium]|nr:30S ribosomal protein S5 [Candidatus Uhrbacteria bacterium]MBD3284393.1 30S ribosomal protein S5 [Candidatus Uhrbacteria bacterium]